MAAPSTDNQSNALLVKRLLVLSWQYRRQCISVLSFQVVLLAMGLTGLRLSGVAIDTIQHALQPDTAAPQVPVRSSSPGRLEHDARGRDHRPGRPGDGSDSRAAQLLLRGLGGAARNLEIVPTLRAQVYDKMQRLSFRFFDANASGSIINRVTSDVQSLRSFVDGVLIQSVIMVLSLGVYLVYMLSKNVTLTLACLVSTPITWAATTAFSRIVRPDYRRNRELVDEMVLGALGGHPRHSGHQGLRPRGARAREVQHRERKRSAIQQQRVFWRVSLYSPMVDVLGQANLMVLLGYGGWLVTQRALTLGDLMVFADAHPTVLEPGQQHGRHRQHRSQQSLIGARRVFEVLDTPIEIKNSERSRAARQDRAARCASRMSTSLTDEGNLRFAGSTSKSEPGQCVAIVGATGSGKSTLLSLIPRFYDPARGTDPHRRRRREEARRGPLAPQHRPRVPRELSLQQHRRRQHRVWQPRQPPASRSSAPPRSPLLTSSSWSCPKDTTPC